MPSHLLPPDIPLTHHLPPVTHLMLKQFIFTLVAMNSIAITEAIAETTATSGKQVTSKTIALHNHHIRLTMTVKMDDFQDLEQEVDEMRQLYFKHWPIIAQSIDAPLKETPTHLTVSFREKMGHPAHVAGTTMVLEASHLRKHPDDTRGVFIHELTHVIQNYPGGAPGWFTEGAADYIRYQTFPNSKWAQRNKQHTDKSKALHGYWNSTAFLIWIEKTYSPNAVATVSRACKKGKYSDQIWKKITGKSLKSLTEEYSKS